MTALRTFATECRRAVAGLPLPLRVSVSVAAFCGVLGGTCGLVIGLVSYPPTAWFAVLEIGAPAALLGGLVGLVVGGVRQAFRR